MDGLTPQDMDDSRMEMEIVGHVEQLHNIRFLFSAI